MQGLQSDDLGFLVGHSIDLTDVHDKLVFIGSEISAIKGLISKEKPVNLTSETIKRLASAANTESISDVSHIPKVIETKSRVLSTENKTVENRRDLDLGHSIEQVKTKTDAAKIAIVSAISETKESISNVSPPKIAVPQSRGANGQFISKDGENSNRDERGRFIAGSKSQEVAKTETLGTQIGNMGKNVVGAIANLVPERDEADPSVQALGEVSSVFTPVGRGLGKLFTNNNNGVSRGQERWYRRFFKQGNEKTRIDDVANKREQQLLRNIEKKDMGDQSSSSGFIVTLLLAFMGTLATMLLKGFQKLATPLRFLGTFFVPLLKALQALTRAIGLGKLADRLGSPNTKSKRHPGGGGEKVPTGAKAGTKSGAKTVLKKLPIIGALVSAGFLAKDLSDISKTDETKEVKTKQVGSAIGSTAGGLGGVAAGGLTGAAIGSVIPVVGTVAGGIIGSILGGIGGDKVGGMLGDKFGDWVNDLRSSGFLDSMSRDWQIGINAMSIMWRDFTMLSGSIWNGMVSGVQSGWSNVTGFTQLMWDGVGNSFATTTDYLKSSWAIATSVIGGVLNSVWGSLGSMATSISDTVKAYTGLDLAKNFNGLKTTVGGWVDGLKNTVSGVSSTLKQSLSDWSSNLFGGYFGDVFNQAAGMVDNASEAASTSKEQDANQTGVLNAFLKAGFSKNQAIALTAEVGRENSYNSKNLYGYHKDAANGAVNMGMISWQGDRAKRLQAHMQQKGLIQNGKMVRSQAALDAQAEFVKQEIESGQYGATQKLFNQKDLNPEAYAKTLGTDYVKWAYGQNVLKSGDRFDWKKHDGRRRSYMQKAETKTNVSIPYRRGYTPPSKPVKSNELANKGTELNTALPTAESNSVDPNSIEGLMQTFNNYDGMAAVKEAVVAMVKQSAEGKGHAKAHIRHTAAVPAVNVPTAAKIADEPKVSIPFVNSQTQDSNSSIDDVSRDIADRRFAHIVTGGHSSSF